jgi:hypothetical protein
MTTSSRQNATEGPTVGIEATDADIGRAVVYTGNRSWGGPDEEGVITSFNERNVFVRYGANKGSQATSRTDLEWVRA